MPPPPPRSILVVTNDKISFFFVADILCVCVCVYTTCSFSSIWHLGFFYILAIVNKTSANVVVHVSFQISVLLSFV